MSRDGVGMNSNVSYFELVISLGPPDPCLVGAWRARSGCLGSGECPRGGDSGLAEENEDVTCMGKSASPSPGKGDTDGLEVCSSESVL